MITFEVHIMEISNSIFRYLRTNVFRDVLKCDRIP